VGGKGIGLAASIEALRAELLEAIEKGYGKRMRFKLDPIELTLQAVVTKDVDGKIGWQILEAGGSFESEKTQSIKVKLTPLWTEPDGTSTEDFSIADQGSAGQHFGPR
jgi:Trypsin-co-occurring domain 2